MNECATIRWQQVLMRVCLSYSATKIVIGLAVLALASRAVPECKGQETKTASDKGAQQTNEIRLRGRIVCLPEEMHRLYQTHLPTPHEHLYGFKTNDGTFYTLLRTRTSEALFADKRLREMELIVQGRVLPNTQILDVIPVGSFHNGKLYDLYYYCTVCAIRTPIPGICMCCQQPVEFVEKPFDQ